MAEHARLHEFFLEIFADHMEFCFTTLGPNEPLLFNEAQRVYALCKNASRHAETISVAECLAITEQVRTVKLAIIRRQIVGPAIVIGYPPTFWNHTVNELENYVNRLTGKSKTGNELLDEHELWLVDGAGHAAALIANLDPTEKLDQKAIKEVRWPLDALAHKAQEFVGYLRTGVQDFPALQRLGVDSMRVMKIFINILTELETDRFNLNTLGTLSPKLASHMLKEELWYIGGSR